jgi:hypothetical protein
METADFHMSIFFHHLLDLQYSNIQKQFTFETTLMEIVILHNK